MYRMGRRKSKTGTANENGNTVEESNHMNTVETSEVMDINPCNGIVSELTTPTTSVVIGGDHTSSDYYFDSYGHFGMCLSVCFHLFVLILISHASMN